MRMLKGCAVLAVVVGLACLPAAAAGSFAAFGSYWNTSDFDHGAGGGLKFAAPFGQSNWGFAVRGTYFHDITEDNGRFDNFKVRVVPVELGLNYTWKPSNVRWYLEGGPGYYFLDTNTGNLDDEVGYYGLAGLETGHEGAGFFVEVNYRWMAGTVKGIQSPGSPSLKDEVHFHLKGPGANAGIVWRW